MTRSTHAARTTGRLALAALTSVLAAACGGTSLDSSGAPDTNSMRERRIEEMGSIFGEEGISFGGDRDENAAAEGGIGVNSFLWRGTLDTLSFMPITSADPFGGVILTDWYSPSGTARTSASRSTSTSSTASSAPTACASPSSARSATATAAGRMRRSARRPPPSSRRRS